MCYQDDLNMYFRNAAEESAAFVFGLKTNKTTCYAGEFPDSFSFKNKKTSSDIISAGSPAALD